MRQASFEVPPVTRVSSAFGMPGGGYEMYFPYEIPPEFLKQVPNAFIPGPWRIWRRAS